MTAHSNKALETLRLLDIDNTTWKVCEFRWVKELRSVQEEGRCSTCDGNRAIIEGEPVVKHPDYGTKDFYANVKLYNEYQAKIQKIVPGAWDSGNCPGCIRKKYRCTGRSWHTVQREVLVGYPIFPEGVKFDSRFLAGCSCGLCGKTILKSNLVPLYAFDSKGQAHGMYVGSDCTKKILRIKFSLKKDQQLELGEIK